MNPDAQSVIDNLLNGNLTQAEDDAKFIPAGKLIHEAEGRGYNYNEALVMVSYLKGIISFQDYCDNLNNTK